MWRQDKIERSLAAIAESGALMVVHTATLINEVGESVGEMRRNVVKTESFPPCTLEPWTMFWGFLQTFDRRLLDILPYCKSTRGKDSNNPESVLGHDGWLSFLAGAFGVITAIDEQLASYRQHSSNVFGFQDRNLIGKIRAKIGDEEARVRRVNWLVDIARHRLNVLEMHAGTDARFASLIAHWRRVHRHCVGRRNLNTGPKLHYRFGHLAVNLVRGTYRHPRNAGLGPNRFLEDATLGMLGRQNEYSSETAGFDR